MYCFFLTRHDSILIQETIRFVLSRCDQLLRSGLGEDALQESLVLGEIFASYQASDGRDAELHKLGLLELKLIQGRAFATLGKNRDAADALRIASEGIASFPDRELSIGKIPLSLLRASCEVNCDRPKHALDLVNSIIDEAEQTR